MIKSHIRTLSNQEVLELSDEWSYFMNMAAIIEDQLRLAMPPVPRDGSDLRLFRKINKLEKKMNIDLFESVKYVARALVAAYPEIAYTKPRARVRVMANGSFELNSGDWSFIINTPQIGNPGCNILFVRSWKTSDNKIAVESKPFCTIHSLLHHLKNIK